LPVKIVPEMTYYVSSGTLSSLYTTTHVKLDPQMEAPCVVL